MSRIPLLLAYDHEDPGFRRWIAWIEARDTEGLVVPFPMHNPELVRMAPELAACPLEDMPHGVDAGSHRVFTGPLLLAEVFQRLPGWGWAASLLLLPGLDRLLYRLWGPGPRTRQGRGRWRD